MRNLHRVRRDLVRGLKQPHHGRRGLTAAQVLRALVLMRVKNWDYRELRERIADVLRNPDRGSSLSAMSRGSGDYDPVTLRSP
jgi:hypothetical protein